MVHQMGVLEPTTGTMIAPRYPPVNGRVQWPAAIHLLTVDYSIFIAIVELYGASGDFWSRLVWQVFIGPRGLMHSYTC